MPEYLKADKNTSPPRGSATSYRARDYIKSPSSYISARIEYVELLSVLSIAPLLELSWKALHISRMRSSRT
ncbi:unnamed protein product [Zymoseptoria tritici ST99CH_3D7]|uniref:Uncharacterized protein n=1 Tax=Zymoseptoria tritici (strain ST99CH_3D7) TaxID=1276538 RepID=A0A1X7S6J5_ZYMT9|nr:unnamed protein product [Zymoseptoria tritici ST99CH_3D7]